jgi:hypothetical protein
MKVFIDFVGYRSLPGPCAGDSLCSVNYIYIKVATFFNFYSFQAFIFRLKREDTSSFKASLESSCIFFILFIDFFNYHS